ncbi:MAG: DNA topoisomerase IV subunit A [Rickettsiales bacterium]|nr:MAG: DNA topoisomerase IV subunit A [Rickettsiales bacterium]
MSNKNDNIENVDFGDAISERYLSYALSTIMSRSLPDVRDGLKPVHRRLLYAMLKLNLDPASRYKKCARVVGDVIGKYHPHGDTAVYDTLVRLAQGFSLRYPLIDGQGNFGSIDGDNAAAMRYTESKMTEICTLLMQDIDQDTVDFRATYDESDTEPVLMPAQFPNLLANGSEGIAVGMATSIPPHNLHELCDALIYLIDNQKEASCADMMRFIKGPDFPTGGTIIDSKEAIASAYNTGKGSFRVRAKWEKESFSHGLYQIVITEIPYQVQKSKLIEHIATLFKDKRIPLISNIRDESTEEIRVIIEPKGRNCSPEMIMESLFKLTALESRVHLNMNVLSARKAPKVMNILEVLQEFIAHRQEVILRRTKYQIGKIDDRLEILHALKIAYLNIDEVIRIIREEDNPKQELIAKFDINAVQAEAILNIRLRALRKLEEEHINAEHDELKKKHVELSKILGNSTVLWKVVKNELKMVQKKFGYDTIIGARKTDFNEIEPSAQIIDISAFIEKEPLTIICSKMGWIRSMKGHNLDLAGLKYKEGDTQAFVIESYTTDNILVCSTAGKFFTILADNIVRGKGGGESVKLMVDIENYDVLQILPHKPAEKILLGSSNGKGFVVNSDDLITKARSGRQVMNVKGDVICQICKPVTGDMVAVIGTNRKLLVFALDEMPEMKRGQGVMLQKYRDAKLGDVKTFNSEEGLSWNLGSKIRLEKEIMSWRAGRGSIGKIPPTGFPKNNKFN